MYKLFILISICNLCSAQNYHPYHIPSTISTEAQLILKSFNPKNKIKSLPSSRRLNLEWIKIKKQFGASASKQIPTLLQDFNPTIDTLYIAGVRSILVTPQECTDSNTLIIYLHGGAYAFFNAFNSLNSIVPLSSAAKLPALVIDYSTAPSANYQVVINEILKVYHEVIHKNGSLNIVFFGDSAGGSLAISSVLKIQQQGLPLPAAIVVWSPWSDIGRVGDTYYTLASHDPAWNYPLVLENCAKAYASEMDFKNPMVSPVYANFSASFPPTLIQAGTKEIFLSNAVRLFRALDNGGVKAKLDIYEGMWHLWQGYYKIPEAKLAIANSAHFILNTLSIQQQNKKIFTLSFENIKKGALTSNLLEKEIGFLEWSNISNRGFITQNPSNENENVLKVNYPKGKVGPNESGIHFSKKLPLSNEYYLDYYIYLNDSFDFRLGGKLPGLTSGGAKFTGGVHPTKGEGWSARYMWVEEGKMVLYFYYVNMKHTYGDPIYFKNKIERGKWYRLTQHIKLNTEKKSNGLLEVWLNGKKEIYDDKVCFRWDNQGYIDEFYFSTFFGGATAEWGPQSDSFIYFKDFFITKIKPQGIE